MNTTSRTSRFPVFTRRITVAALALCGAVACDAEPDIEHDLFDDDAIAEADLDEAQDDIFAIAAAAMPDARQPPAAQAFGQEPRSTAATLDIHGFADSIGMSLIDYLETEMTEANDGLDQNIAYAVLRSGTRTETLVLDLDRPCPQGDNACIGGIPAVLRLQHKYAPDGKSGTLKRWQRDPITATWSQVETVTQSVEAVDGIVSYAAGWTKDGQLTHLAELTANISSIQSVEPGDEVVAMSPFVAADDGSGPVLSVPYHNPSDINTEYGPDDWEPPEYPDEDGTALDCYEAVQGDKTREIERIMQLRSEADGLSLISWLGYGPGSIGLVPVLDMMAYIQSNLIVKSEERLRDMDAWLHDCLTIVGPPTSPIDPNEQQPPGPEDWDVSDLTTCRNCTELLMTGSEFTYETEETDDDGSAITVLNVEVWSGEATCLQWDYGFGVDVNGDGFCDG